MKQRLRGFIILLLALSSFFATAETATVQRKLALFLVFQGNFTVDEKTVLSETLLAKISEIESIAVVEPMWIGTKDITYVEKNDKAVAIGADCYLAITLSGSKDNVDLAFLSYDILQNKIAIEEKKEVRDRELRSLDRSFWVPVVSELAAYYQLISGDLVIKEITKHTGEEKVIEEAKGIKVVILAQPRTVIEGLGKDAYVADDDGLVKLEIAGSTTYELYATCPGFYPVRKQVYIGNEPIRIELEQNQGSLFAIDVFLQQVDYIGAGFRYYYIINKMFVDFKTTFFMWKLIWPVSDDKNRYEAPLVHLALLTGLYINNEDALFRLSVSTGLFLRVIYIDPLGILLDPVSGIGFTLPSLNLEVSTFEKYRFFIEYNVNFYLSENMDFFKESTRGGGSSTSYAPGYIFTDHHLIIDLLDIKIGVRFQL